MKQVRKPIAKKMREIVKDQVAEIEVERKREKAKSHRNMGVNGCLLKMKV